MQKNLVSVKSIKKKSSKLYVNFTIPKNSRSLIKLIRLKHRSGDISYDFVLEDDSTKIVIDLDGLDLQKFYWDFYIILNDNQEIRLKNINKSLRLKLDFLYLSYVFRKDSLLIYPYVTSYGSLSLVVRNKIRYDNLTSKINMMFALGTYMIGHRYYKKQKILLFYEKNLKRAEDNAYQYFKDMSKSTKDFKPVYIYDGSNHDFEDNEKVIKPFTYRYFLYLLSARLLISSEAKTHLSDIRLQNGFLNQILSIKKHLFLQHGVLALKNVDHIYNKSKFLSPDYFLISEPIEKEIVVNNFGYSEEDVVLAGLVRWEVLSKIQEKRQILFMPTWRTELDSINEEDFISSSYYHWVDRVINSKEIKLLCDKYGYEFKVKLHPRFEQYENNFNNISKEQLGTLIGESRLLITDYSSIAWDFKELGKKVILYQPDIDEYMENTGMYINPTEYFNHVVYNERDLLASSVNILSSEREEQKIIEGISDKITEFVLEEYEKGRLQNDFSKNKYISKLSKKIRKK